MRRFIPGEPSRAVNPSWVAVTAAVLVLLLISCSGSVTIGIVACLTGAQSELGVAGRDGALLRFEQEGAKRGVNRFTVVIEDDRNDPEQIYKISQKFAESGIAAAIGPFTSTTALAAAQASDKVLFISPTASAGRLASRDDMLIRLMTSVEAAAAKLSILARKRFGLNSVSAVWDSRNSVYAEDYLRAFAAGWESGADWRNMDDPQDTPPGTLSCLSFGTETDTDLLSASAFLVDSAADAVLIIASGSNAASIIRILRRDGYEGLIMVSGWAVTSDLSAWGSEFLEGVIFSQQYDPSLDSPRFANFRQNYVERFGIEPSFAAIFGYEAADLVIRAIDDGSGRNSLSVKKRILDLEPYDSLQGRLQLDRYGDPLRDVFVFQFHSGLPVRIE